MTISKRIMDIGTPLAMDILNKLYEDNVIVEADEPDTAFRKYAESKQYFQEIRMNLRDFISNDKSFNERIPERDRAN
uniref:Transcriptional regulator n=1 Tax=Heterorhabditis bacteriophora TaxID=37862 RepID=A0A1I7WW25_HETBA